MQLISNILKCIIVLGAISIALGVMPPLYAPAQQNNTVSKPESKDTVLERLETIVSRYENVKEKVENNDSKAKQIMGLLNIINKPSKSNTVVKTRVIHKDRIVKVPTYRDTTLYYIRGKYATLPVILQPACSTYGGDTFDSSKTTYQGPLAGLIPDKPFKRLFKRKRDDKSKLE